MILDTTFHGPTGSSARITITLNRPEEVSLTDEELARVASNQHLLRWESDPRYGASQGVAYVTPAALRAKPAPDCKVTRTGDAVSVYIGDAAS